MFVSENQKEDEEKKVGGRGEERVELEAAARGGGEMSSSSLGVTGMERIGNECQALRRCDCQRAQTEVVWEEGQRIERC